MKLKENERGTFYSLSINYYFLLGEDRRTVYFLHRNDIKKGAELIDVGQTVVFDVVPAMPGAKHPRAVNAIVGDTSNNGGTRQ